MSMIKIGLNGLATYLDADEAGKRKVLQGYKYPNRFQRDYYVSATNAVIRLHRGVPPGDVLRSAAELDSRAIAAPSDPTRRALQHNARAIREWVAMMHGGVAPFSRVPRGLHLRYGNVCISAGPTLALRVRKREVFVRAYFSVEPLSEHAIKVITQCMFEAAVANGMDLPSKSAQLYDVHRGAIHRGARKNSRVAAVVEAAMINIEMLWPSIPQPRRQAQA